MLDVELAPPGPGEVKVKIAGAGVCHSDLHLQKGEWPHPSPLVMGHEGSGVVVEVGEGVTHLAEGDHVVLSWVSLIGPAARTGPLRLVADAVDALVRPVLGPLRSMMPPLRAGGVGIDLSVIVAFVILQVVEGVLC